MAARLGIQHGQRLSTQGIKRVYGIDQIRDSFDPFLPALHFCCGKCIWEPNLSQFPVLIVTLQGFWGMNFTQLDNDRKMYVSTDIWMFVVTGFGSTLAAFIVLYYRRIAATTKTLYNKITPAPVRRPTFRLGNQFTWDIGRKA